MVKKLSIAFLFAVAFFLAFFISAHAETVNPATTKQGISACMKAATSKKKAALSSTKETRIAKVHQAKGNKDKAEVKKSRHDYKQSKKAIKGTFAADRVACKAGRPIKEDNDNDDEKKITLALSAQNNSGITGEVKLEEENGKTKIKITVTGFAQGVAMPVHIHPGSCATIGEAEFPLSDVVDGKSETVINSTIDQLKSQLPLAINLHKSEAESSVYVACGDIK